mgnify:CR=1 FL=1
MSEAYYKVFSCVKFESIWSYPPVPMETHFKLLNIGKWVFLHNFVNLNAIEVKLGSNERYWDGLCYHGEVSYKWANLHIPNLHICPYFAPFYNSDGITIHWSDVSCNLLIYLYDILGETSHECKRKSFQVLSSCRFEDIFLVPWKLIS